MKNNSKLFKSALKYIPLASQTYSKSYKVHFKNVSPYFLKKGNGCYVWDEDNKKWTVDKSKLIITPEMMEGVAGAEGVEPPDFTFITVLIVAPAPGRPENNPAIAFPIPCPINSRSELCLV